MAKREFTVMRPTKVEIDIPDHIHDEFSPAGVLVTEWLERRTFDFSEELRMNLYSDDVAIVERAARELTRLYLAAQIAINLMKD